MDMVFIGGNMVEKNKKKVFIIYAREDQETAKKLYNDLKCSAIKPWLDIEDLMAGQKWEYIIKKTLKNSDYVLMLLSKNSVSRGFVQKEIKIALDISDQFPPSEIFIIPVNLDDCEPNDERLQGLHRVDLFSSYENGLNQIFRALEHPKSIKKESKDSEVTIINTKKNQEALRELVQLINHPEYPRDKALELISEIGQFIIDQLDHDRFTTPEEAKGGWSKLYSKCLLPKLFPKDEDKEKPEDTSPQDSITFTYFVIKALWSVKRLYERLHFKLDIQKVDRLLIEGKEYLYRHYRDGEVGRIIITSQREKPEYAPIAFHIRHTATFGKGLLEYPDEPEERIIKAFKTVYSKSQNAEARVPTQAETLSVLSILRSQPKLRGADIEDYHLESAIAVQEKRLLDRLIHRKGEYFFEDTNATYKSSPFYTWWALYCYGLCMKNSKKDYLRDAYNKVLHGILSLEKKIDDKQSGFPLLIKEEPMIGMTAALAEILVTLEEKKVRDLILRCLNYILCGFKNPDALKEDFPFFYAYAFVLIENCIKSKIFEDL
jgi:hypothetical protein